MNISGVCSHARVRLSDGRVLDLFGDDHARRPQHTDSVHIAEFLLNMFRKHPNTEYTVFLEMYTTIPTQTILNQTDDMNKVWNRLTKASLPNVSIVPSDIRVKGVHTPLTRFIKAYGFARHFPSAMSSLDEDKLEMNKHRFVGLVRGLVVDYDRLWKTFGYQDEKLYLFFQQAFDRMALRPIERERYTGMINAITHRDADRIFTSKGYKSMTAHLLRMGSLFVDLFVCGKIIETPPGTHMIGFFGLDHVDNMLHFFRMRGDDVSPVQSSDNKCLR